MDSDLLTNSRKRAEAYLEGIIDATKRDILAKDSLFEITKEGEYPLRFEAHAYLGHRRENNKAEYAQQMRDLWSFWKRAGIKDFYNAEDELTKFEPYVFRDPREAFFPYSDVYWQEAQFFKELGEAIAEGPADGAELECCISMLRAREILDVPGFKDDFNLLLKNLKAFTEYSFTDPSSRENLWQITRCAKVQRQYKPDFENEAFRISGGIKNYSFQDFNDKRLLIHQFEDVLSGVLWLVFSGLNEKYFNTYRDATEKIIDHLEDNGSVANDIITTCEYLLAAHFSKLDTTSIIQDKALEWLISQQDDDGSWKHWKVEICDFENWNVLSTAIVLETIDLITNDSPLPLWTPGRDLASTAPRKVKTAKPIIKFPTPKGAKWQDVSIHFISNEEVQIRAGNVRDSRNYSQMGFERKKKEPDVIWGTLKAFALCDGAITWEDKIFDLRKKDAWKNSFVKLRKRLIDFFDIRENPITYVRESVERVEEKEYEIAGKIIKDKYKVEKYYKTEFNISIAEQIKEDFFVGRGIDCGKDS